MTPTVKRGVPADTRRIGGGPNRTEVEGVVEVHQTIRTQAEETDFMGGSEEDVAPGAIRDRRALRDLGDPQARLDEKATRDRPQESET